MSAKATPDEADKDTDEPSSRGWWRREGAAFLELMGLCGIAIAEPIFAVTGAAQGILVLERVEPLQLAVFALIVVLVPPLVLLAIELVVQRIRPAARTPVHVALLGIVAATFVMQLLRGGGVSAPLLVLTTAVLVAAVFIRYVPRYPAAQQWLRWLAIAPVWFMVSFLVFSPAADLFTFTNPDLPTPPDNVGDTPVVLVIFDELPLATLLNDDNQIDEQLFPGFAQLAGNSTWYRNTTSVAPTSSEAQPAIMTGKYPEWTNQAAVAKHHPESLFALLADSHEFNVFEGYTQVCPPSLCEDKVNPRSSTARVGNLLRAGADAWYQRVQPFADVPELSLDLRQAVPGRDDANDVFARFNESIVPTSGPTLTVMQSDLPHQPWRHYPDGTLYNGPSEPDGTTGVVEFVSADAADNAARRHLLQVQLADRLLADLLAKLHETGRYDESLIIVTSDHGIGFAPDDPARGTTLETAPGVLWVPLLVKEPGQTRPELVEDPTMTIDIVPTVAEALGAELPWELDGRSLLSTSPTRERRFYAKFFNTDLDTSDDGWLLVDDTWYQRMLERPAVLDSAADPAFAPYQIADVPLVGTRLDELDVGSESTTRVGIDSPGATRQVGPPGYLPGYVRGSVSDSSRPVVVTVNDTVAMTAQPEVDGSFFGVTLPTAWHDGDNQLRFFAVGEDGTTLHELTR